MIEITFNELGCKPVSVHVENDITVGDLLHDIVHNKLVIGKNIIYNQPGSYIIRCGDGLLSLNEFDKKFKDVINNDEEEQNDQDIASSKSGQENIVFKTDIYVSLRFGHSSNPSLSAVSYRLLTKAIQLYKESPEKFSIYHSMYVKTGKIINLHDELQKNPTDNLKKEVRDLQDELNDLAHILSKNTMTKAARK